ncbi:hypothetical protein DPX16_1707 [Anabarilius grahami]|uniref:Uncharacterized protein n=1 Tax=Anabarilius grahami TaxID=495550 RepID=A0A3N0YW99_ANAGA|nr:hypothetical protein DPX16_1707 [Anabarilius grahami]
MEFIKEEETEDIEEQTGTGSGVTSEFFNLNLSVCENANCLNIWVHSSEAVRTRRERKIERQRG